MDYEQILALMKARRSIRRFAPRRIGRAVIGQLLEAARWAPSNHNRQPWKFLVLEDPDRIRALAERIQAELSARWKRLPALAAAYAGDLAHYATLFAGAPVVLVVLHKQPASVAASLLEGVPHPALVSGEPLSAAMAVQNLLLAGQALGVGTCVMTAPLLAPEAVSGGLPLPAGHDLTCLVAVGYPDEAPEAPRRKTLEQICDFMDTAVRLHDNRATNL